MAEHIGCLTYMLFDPDQFQDTDKLLLSFVQRPKFLFKKSTLLLLGCVD
jgi:hypothetical protein